MELLGNALVTFEKRISAKDHTGKLIESPDESLKRVAQNLASAETRFGRGEEFVQLVADGFYDLMSRFDFLPNSPCLVNAGRPLQQLAACFVLPVDDSIEDIFESVKMAALIHKSGGGTGFGFGRLRPAGGAVASTGREASGPVSFMQVFDAATNSIKQGGVRRGANMGVLPVDHPDIEEFIHLKNDNKTLSNFNVSVAVTDEFMDCLANEKPFALRWKGNVVRYVDPRDLWRQIAESAWISGDPGVLFMDRINAHNTVPHLGRIEATNPCGEVPLLAWHTCNLGSLNLANFVSPLGFDYRRLEGAVHLAVRLLDNIIEMNAYPHEKIEQETKKARKIGLGVMGWADALIKLRVPYGSADARELAKELMANIRAFANEASVSLAKERGSFPAFEGSRCQEEFPDGIRNSSRTVMAPTGTLSILADCSSGIEPLFALTFTKNVMDTSLTHVARAAFELIEASYPREAAQNVIRAIRNGVSPTVACPELADILATAHEISVEDHVEMQAAFQEYTDDSISKTINFPHDATVEQIMDAYQLAWDSGCKGITIYRDGCKDTQVLVGIETSDDDLCVDCGVQLINSEGCTHCPQCGVSMCEA